MAITTSLIAANAGQIVAPGNESQLYFQLFNSSGTTSATVSWTLTRQDGATSSSSGSTSVPGGGTANVSLPIAGQPFGHRWVDWTTTWSGGSAGGRFGFHYGHIPSSARDSTGFAWGMNHADNATDFNTMAPLGLDHIRTRIEWSQIENPLGSFDWSPLDTEVSQAAAAGLDVWWLIAYGRVTDAFGTPPPLSGSGAYNYFAGAGAARYGNRIKGYEIWNEPNSNQFWGGDIPTYIAMLQAASNTIRANYPGAIIALGGMAGVYGFPGSLLIPDLERQSLLQSAYFDLHMFHPHDVLPTMEQDLSIEAPWRAAMSPTRPLFANEVGIPTMNAQPSQYLAQAVETVKKIAVAKSVGIVGWTFYELIDGGTDITYSENNFGIMTTDRQPKPCYGAIAELLYRIKGKSYYGTLSGLTSNMRLYIFQGASGYLTVFWNQGGSTSSPSVYVGPGATATDMWGNPISLAPSDATHMTLNFPANPTYIMSSVAPGSAPLISSISGSVAMTQGSQRVAASGSEKIAGTAALVQPGLTYLAYPPQIVPGTAAIVQAGLQSSAIGQIVINGSAAITQAPLTIHAIWAPIPPKDGAFVGTGYVAPQFPGS